MSRFVVGIDGSTELDNKINEIGNTLETITGDVSTLNNKIDQDVKTTSDVNFLSLVVGDSEAKAQTKCDVNGEMLVKNPLNDAVFWATQTGSFIFRTGTPGVSFNNLLTANENKITSSVPLEVEGLNIKNSIETNTGNITTNTSNITTNTANITTNTGNIATINNKLDQDVKTTSDVIFNTITATNKIKIGDVGTGPINSSLTLTDDNKNNTGEYLSFVTNNTKQTAAQFKWSGNNGIILKTDTLTLDKKNNTENTKFTISSDQIAQLVFNSATGTVFLENYPNNDFTIRNANNDTFMCSNNTYFLKNDYNITQREYNLSILNNGNIGIGTGTPSQKLDVKGNAGFTGTVTGGNFNTTGEIRFKHATNPTDYKIINDNGNLKITSDNNPLIEFQENNNNTLRIGCDNLDVVGSSNFQGLTKITGEFVVQNGLNDGVIWTGDTGTFIFRTGTPGVSFSNIFIINNNKAEINTSHLGLPTATSDPATARVGSIYFNTTTDKVRLKISTGWISIN